MKCEANGDLLIPAKSAMPTYRLIGGYRATFAVPCTHVHLIAIGTAELSAGDYVPTKAWTAKDLQRAKGPPAFVQGPIGATLSADVSVATCPECGELVVRVFPAELEAGLPECRIG